MLLSKEGKVKISGPDDYNTIVHSEFCSSDVIILGPLKQICIFAIVPRFI